MLKEQLVAVYKNPAGDVISFQTSGGRIISYRKALLEAEAGIITGVNIQVHDPDNEEEPHASFESLSIADLPEYN